MLFFADCLVAFPILGRGSDCRARFVHGGSLFSGGAADGRCGHWADRKHEPGILAAAHVLQSCANPIRVGPASDRSTMRHNARFDHPKADDQIDTTTRISEFQRKAAHAFGGRWIFIHLFILALMLTFLRSKMSESKRWEESQSAKESAAPFIDWKALFSGRYLATILYVSAMYGPWDLWAGNNGLFAPYLIEQHEAERRAQMA